MRAGIWLVNKSRPARRCASVSDSPPVPEATLAAKPEAPKRARNSTKTKASILAAGRVEFADRGFEGARVDAIAERAGANKRLLYHYFGNKEDLYRAVLLDAYQEIRRGERALSLDQYDPVQAMDRLVRFTFRHFLANPWFPRLLGTENIENARFLKTLPDIEALHSPLVGQIAAILARGHAAGSSGRMSIRCSSTSRWRRWAFSTCPTPPRSR